MEDVGRVHIIAYCPTCRSRYQLEPSMLGKRMRCNNALCREVFEVREEDKAPPKVEPGPSNPKSISGQVGEIVTVLEAELVRPAPIESQSYQPEAVAEALPIAQRIEEPASPPKPQPSRSWQEPPPVRRGKDKAPTSPVESPIQAETEPTTTVAEAEKTELVTVGVATASEPSPSATEIDLGQPARRRAVWLMVIMGLLTVGTVGGVGIAILRSFLLAEQNLAQRAAKDYEDGRFDMATQAYEDLVEKFPASSSLPAYQFRLELSRLSNQAFTLLTDPIGTLQQVREFVANQRDNPLTLEHKPDIYQLLRQLSKVLASQAGTSGDAASLKEARAALAESRPYRIGSAADKEEIELVKELARVESIVAKAQRKAALAQQLSRWRTENPTSDRVREARVIVRQEGLAEDAQIKSRLAELEAAVLAQVRYVSVASDATPRLVGEIEPSIVFLPRVAGTAQPATGAGRVMLALVRGVLHALDRATGSLVWAVRVGIDTTSLPVRLPATAWRPEELFLVVSAERNTLMALYARDGNICWQRPLEDTALGRPVVIGRRVYVGTSKGRVLEIETAGGSLLGYFELNQFLTVGGVWQEGTDLLYYPGDSDNIYVLDVGPRDAVQQGTAKKRCVAVLRTGHPSGSLRSEPILVNRIDPSERRSQAQSWPGYLILTQSDGLDHMKLRVFSLPIERADVAAIVQPEPRIRGWSWFPPYHDPEKFAFVTDAGLFSLYGVNQIRNEDKPIFPMLAEPQALGGKSLGRGQVVHAAEDDLWVLAGGVLERRHFDPYRQRLSALWEAPVPLGSPVHAAELDDAEKTLYVVTHDLARQVYLATAVDAEKGKVLWQRQLGLEPQGEALTMGDRVLLLDRGGSVYGLEVGKLKRDPRKQWQVNEEILAGPIPGQVGRVVLLPSPDGKSAIEIGSPHRDRQLTLRQIPLDGAGKPITVTVTLPAAMSGIPNVGPKSLILPLADGTLQRLALPLEGNNGMNGPNWRSARADDDAQGFVAQLGNDEFLCTDGSNGITHWAWTPDGDFHRVPRGAPNPMAQLPARIVAPPLVLPPVEGAIEPQVIVADAYDEGTVALLHGPSLKLARFWNMRGRITAGPFQRGGLIGCVVDRKAIVWIDPRQEKIVRRDDIAGDGIVGQPALMGDRLIVADLSGKFEMLDWKTGKKLASYNLKTAAAPTAAPVPYGDGLALVPLTDGTVFMLEVELANKPPQ